jgi:hypothetical protein
MLTGNYARLKGYGTPRNSKICRTLNYKCNACSPPLACVRLLLLRTSMDREYRCQTATLC